MSSPTGSAAALPGSAPTATSVSAARVMSVSGRYGMREGLRGARRGLRRGGAILRGCTSAVSGHRACTDMAWIDGAVYVGEWKNDERHGEGTMTTKHTHMTPQQQ